jgi:hypothetical protein
VLVVGAAVVGDGALVGGRGCDAVVVGELIVDTALLATTMATVAAASPFEEHADAASTKPAAARSIAAWATRRRRWSWRDAEELIRQPNSRRRNASSDSGRFPRTCRSCAGRTRRGPDISPATSSAAL